MTRSMPTFRRILLLCLSVLLAACASSSKHRDDLLRVALYDYESAVRWSQFGEAAGFLDPTLDPARLPKAVDMQRYEQIQVTGYYEQAGTVDAENRYRQVVEIRFVNRHTQAERSVIDHQTWRFDPETRRWWLSSGLPDLTAR